MKEEEFTQRAYLQSGAIWRDSEFFDSSHFAFMKSAESAERWANSVARCLYGPQDFRSLEERIRELYFKQSINFNWHVWPSSHPKLLEFLTTKIGMNILGAGRALFKKLEVCRPLQPNILPLTEETKDEFVTAKMLGWENSPNFRDRVDYGIQKLISDLRNFTLMLKYEDTIVAGVSAFIENDFAYLKGDFVIPSKRRQGFYKALIEAREAHLKARGVKTVTTIADDATSAPVFQSMGYQDLGRIEVLARKPSEWISI